MAHKDWTMIARFYGRWMPDADASAGLQGEKVFGRAYVTDLTLTSTVCVNGAQ